MKKLLSVALIILTLSSCQDKKTPGEKIRIGYYGALTGKQSTFGISSLGGLELAMVKINRAGGINGSKIELFHYDTKGSAELAKEAVEKLIVQDKVVAIIGENITARTLSGAEVAQRHKIPMITPTATHPKITKIGDYIFRACFIDSFQGEVVAKFAFGTLRYKRAAIFRESSSEYSVGLSQYFKEKFTQLGGTIVAEETYNTKDVVYLSPLQKIQKAKPDFIFVPGYYFDVAKIAFQSRDLGIRVPLIGGDGWDSPQLVSLSKSQINDSYFSSHFTETDPRPEVRQFINEYTDLFKFSPDAFSAAGYDAANMVFTAIREGESFNPKDIRDNLAKIKDFTGVTGKITINENRDAIKSAPVLQVLSGKFNYIQTIDP